MKEKGDEKVGMKLNTYLLAHDVEVMKTTMFDRFLNMGEGVE
jgi:hypothetical protein